MNGIRSLVSSPKPTRPQKTTKEIRKLFGLVILPRKPYSLTTVVVRI